MRPSRARFITACQQLLALGVVLAVLTPAAGVISLDVVVRRPDGTMAAVGHGAITPDSAPALVATRPVDATVREIALTQRAAHTQTSGRSVAPTTPNARMIPSTGGRTSVLSAPQEVDGFGTVGLTWQQGESVAEDAVSMAVRFRETGETAWSDWTSMPYHDDHGPDADSREALHARPGSDAVIVGDVSQVQVKLVTTGAVPDDLQLAVISPGVAPTEVEAPAIDTGALDAARADGTEAGIPGEPTSTPAPATDEAADDTADGTAGLELQAGVVTARPHIFSRAQWGADERLRDPGSLHYYEVHAGFVHHTVNANDYTTGEVPGILRSIYAYHTQSRGWSDIGYNFLVDRFGRIWEGRYGGVDRPVVGAHTLGYNDYSFAMSAIGNFEQARPSAAMLDAYGRLFAWKLSLHGVDPASTRQRVGDTWFPAINGHRDAASTACPGRYLYAKIPTIRTLAEEYQAGWSGRQRDVDVASTPYPDLLVRRTSDKAGFIVPTQGLLRLTWPRVSQSSGWSAMDSIVASPDLTGDGKVDLVARTGSTGVSMVYPGDGTGRFGGGIKSTAGFRGLDLITAVGDLNGDLRNDFVARNPSTGRLHLFYNVGGGSFRHVLLAADFGSYDKLAGVGDFTGDGKRDLLARSAGGGLWLFPGTGTVKLGTPTQLAGGWKGYDVLTGYGDYNKDGKPDLFARNASTGNGYVFPNLGGGRFGHWLGPLPTVKGLTSLTSGGNVTDGGPADLVGRRGDALVVVAHTGTYDTSTPIAMGSNLAGATMLLSVGDWDGDGKGDLVTRTSTGALFLRLGNGAGGFGTPTQIGSGFDKVGLIAAVGDVTGDGYPDLQGQPTGAAMRIYPGRGTRGLGVSYVAHGNISANRQIGVGLWNSDGAPDSVFRVGTKLAVYPGNGPGGLMDGTTTSVDVSAYDWIIGVGNVTGTRQPDLVVREKATGFLWVLPGNGNGVGTRAFLGEGFGGYDLAG